MKNLGILFLIACTVCSYSQEREKTEPMFPSYKGLIMAGYQGWFRADGDEAGVISDVGINLITRTIPSTYGPM